MQVDSIPEPVDQDPYEAWRREPTPGNLNRVVKSLDPGIKHTLHQIGAGSDPYLYSQARMLTAKAVQSYDPEYGAQLPTWVNRQLLPLRRMRREKQTAVKIPESAQLDAMALHQAENEFMEKHNREPDLLELSDAAQIPVRRIEKVRKQFVKFVHDDQLNPDTADSSGEAGGAAISHSEPEHGQEATEYVYHESDYVDRKILEHKTGFGGAPVLNGAEIAKKLGISPASVTRRSAKLTYKINQYRQILENP